MIKSVTISNWKAFANPSLITFKTGLNLFVGTNGSGKTSLLEGICLGLVGRCSVDAIEELVRDPQKEANVNITISQRNREFRVTRSFGHGRKRAELIDLTTDERTVGWEAVTERICNIWGIDISFFQRLIYMSEGEIQRCVIDPPQKAISNQIRALSGQADIESVRGSALKLSRSIQRNIDDGQTQLEQLQDVLETGADQLDNLRAELSAKRKSESQTNELVSGFVTELEVVQKTEEQFVAIEAELKKIRNIAIAEHLIQEREEFTVSQLQLLQNRFASNSQEREAARLRLSTEIGAASASISNLKNIQELLEAARAPGTSAPCPVCKRPIDEKLASILSREIAEQLSKQESDLASLSRRTDELASSFASLQSDIDRVKISADHVFRELQKLPPEFRNQPPNLTLGMLREKRKKLEASINEMNKQLDALRVEIEPLEQSIAIVLESKRRLELKKSIEESLVSSFRKQMLLTVVNETLSDVLHSRQELDMDTIYAEIARMWNRFRPGEQWRFSIDSGGSPMLFVGDRRLRYAHLSGGEKTILLVLIRAILIKHITNLDFLLIDEPLEHLDTRNRRSLLNFIYGIADSQIIPQVIITTFEETLTRRFYDQEGVTMNYLRQKNIGSAR